MDASRDIIESAKPPKPPRPGARPEPMDRGRGASPLAWIIAACAAAAAVFTGITAWETHQDRLNTETVYCTFMSGAQPDEMTPSQKRMADQLGCSLG
ncbi:hypothetical protein L2K70_08675 [Nocardioides KLBMP 9356]|uniref:Uncharacterized protein n=1 Tax=Nocardioides potassii TaxID=2911371 RepID=A0ABS9H8Y6_9ACTN|nr:hypothetical protein [Nocardioides potassii]MCF6377677.1 hypothetical protein [Nocardioides potassii]